MNDRDTRRNLAQETNVVRAIKRIGRGARKVRTDGDKRSILGIVWCLLLMVWLYYGLGYSLALVGPLARLNRLAVGMGCLLLAAALPIALCWAWGGPLMAGKIRRDLIRVGFVNTANEAPEPIAITRDKDNPRLRIYEFECSGLPVTVWKDFAEKLQTALNATIIDVQYAEDNQHIKMTVAPPASTLPSQILWLDGYRPLVPYVVAAGVDTAGQVITWDLCLGHAILAGMTGSGKTVLLKCFLWQCLCWGADIRIADFKGLVGFSRWRKKCSLYTTAESLLSMLDELIGEIKNREKQLADNQVQDIDSYNRNHRTRQLRHIVLAVDEVAELFDKTGASKPQKAVIEQIEHHISSIARKGRTAGVHLLLATQRPDALTLPPQVKANISFSACGAANKVLSEIVLDSTAAADMIPRGAQGRFVTNQGADTYTVFQAYLFGEWRLDYD